MPNQFTPLLERFENSYSPEPNTGCWLWTGAISADKAKTDYRPQIRDNGKVRRAYRVAYELFIGPIPEGKIICHKCDVPTCVNPQHLYAGTDAQNAADCIRRGRHNSQKDRAAAQARGFAIGSRNTWTAGRLGKSIIPHCDIPKIKSRFQAGESLGAIAAEYKVSKQAIWRFMKRAIARAALSQSTPNAPEVSK